MYRRRPLQALAGSDRTSASPTAIDMKADTVCSDSLATPQGVTYPTHHLHRRIKMSYRVLDCLSFLIGIVMHSTARRM
jgi:hypothetical protein